MHHNKKYLALDKFIYQALYNQKDGFYMKKNPFGVKGDFITSPNISILFSEMISIWSIAFWEKLKFPKKFNLIELGSGNGEMILQMIKSFQKFAAFQKACRIIIFEKSSYLKKIQQKKLKQFDIKWIKNLNEISDGPNIFVANEFFDALPIKQFYKIKKKWTERYVDITNKNNFKFINKKININNLEDKVGFKISKDQKIIEYSPLSHKYLKDISKILISKNGALLIIDYGYLDVLMSNTLQSIKKHKKTNMLSSMGKSDITYQINFKLMERISKKLKLKSQGITSQRNFLINMGILHRAEIISKNLPFSKKADIYFRLKRLIDKNQMGDLFKVMLITNKKINFKTGFKLD